jgi:hypothetical protein
VQRSHLEYPNRPQRSVTLRVELRVLHIAPIGTIGKPYSEIDVASQDGMHAIGLQVVNELESPVRQQAAELPRQLVAIPRTGETDRGLGWAGR